MSHPPSSPSKYATRHQPSYSGGSAGEGSTLAVRRPSFIDLSSSAESPRDGAGARVARKAFFCDVVVEDGRGEGTTALLSTLGDQMNRIPYPPELSSTSTSATTPGRMSRSESVDGFAAAQQTSKPDPKKLQPLLDELLSTERTYVRRLRALKTTYADPLRLFSRDPSMAIIPPYNATALFGNIDAIVLVNESFLADLERSIAGIENSHGGAPEGVGDVIIRHFKQMKAFDCYRTYYDKCEDAQAMFADMISKRKSFQDFVQASKYKTEGVSNVGLRELLMEPVQRIPRYTMIWQLMVKSMDMSDSQRQKLVEATEIASAIATCEKDDNTKRMIVMSGLARVMEGFPAELINNNRDYYDSLDAEDLPPDLVNSSLSSHTTSGGITTSTSNPLIPGVPSSSSSSSASSLHCTLFLFSDRLLIAKRPSAHQSGRKLTGLDDVSKLWKGSIIGGGGAGGGVGVRGGPGRSGISDSSRDGGGKLSCKGVVSILDVVASDIGGGDFHLHLLRPPMEPSPRWSGRPSRRFTVVHPPQPIYLDPQAARADKHRFVHNLWAAQALLRARGGKSSVLVAAEEETLMDAWGKGRARAFWNVWGREGWEGEGGKAKIVVQVDDSGGARPLAFGDGCAPHVVVRVQPLAGNMCRMSVHTRDSDEAEDIVHITSVSSKIMQTIHRLGLYQPRSDSKSCPTTPTSAHTRRPMLGLDAISRNLFGTGSMSSRGEGGGFGSMSHKRTRSATSKASTIDSSITRSTVSSLGRNSDDGGTNSDCNRKTRGKSPTSPGGSRDGGTSPYGGAKRKPVPRDDLDESECDLTAKLELARKNSESAARNLMSDEGEEAEMALDFPDHVIRPAEVTAPTTTSTESSSSTATPGFASTSPLRVRNKTPTVEKTAFLEPSPEFIPSIELRPLSPPIARGLSPSNFSRALSPSIESKRPLGPRGPTPSSSTAVGSPLALNPVDARRALQTSLGHGLGSSHTKIRLMSSESGHRRVSDEWRKARPSLPPGSASSTSPALPPLPVAEDAPDSPCSTSSSKRRDRAKSMEVASPTLGKRAKREKEDIPPRSPLLPRTGGDALWNGSPKNLVGKNTGLRKVSLGAAGVKGRVLDKDLAAMSVEERAGVLVGVAKDDATSSRRTVKRMRLEVEGLRSHFSKDLAQKDRLARMGETPGGSLPRSPPSRNISRRADHRPGRVEEARQALEQSSGYDYPPSSSSSSSRKAGVDVAFLDDWCGVLEGLVDELDRDLKRAVGNSEALKGDITTLIEGKKNTGEILTLQSQLDVAQTHLEQARRLSEDQKNELLDCKNENAALYEAFNEELEQMYADMTLPGAEAHVAMKRDIQVTKADRNALRLENATLKRELEQAIYEKERNERLMRQHGLLP